MLARFTLSEVVAVVSKIHAQVCLVALAEALQTTHPPQREVLPVKVLRAKAQQAEHRAVGAVALGQRLQSM
jgi:hypothetical protein